MTPRTLSARRRGSSRTGGLSAGSRAPPANEHLFYLSDEILNAPPLFRQVFSARSGAPIRMTFSSPGVYAWEGKGLSFKAN